MLQNKVDKMVRYMVQDTNNCLRADLGYHFLTAILDWNMFTNSPIFAVDIGSLNLGVFLHPSDALYA